jgi:hypothetical protein
MCSRISAAGKIIHSSVKSGSVPFGSFGSFGSSLGSPLRLVAHSAENFVDDFAVNVR